MDGGSERRQEGREKGGDGPGAAEPRSAKQEFIRLAEQGKVLAHKCAKCGRLDLATAYFCRECGGGEFADAVLDGRGKVATYTIITVPPEGFEGHTPYAWVVLDLDGCDLRLSGFMAGIGSPADLPVGAPARIVGRDGRGVVIETV